MSTCQCRCARIPTLRPCETSTEIDDGRRNSDAGGGVARDDAGAESKVDWECQGGSGKGDEENDTVINQEEDSAVDSTADTVQTIHKGPPNQDVQWAISGNVMARGQRAMARSVIQARKRIRP